jgi:hypothetical protein
MWRGKKTDQAARKVNNIWDRSIGRCTERLSMNSLLQRSTKRLDGLATIRNSTLRLA